MNQSQPHRDRKWMTSGWRGRVSAALILVIVLSLLPAPLSGPAGAQTPDLPAIPEPPAQAVRLLERLRDRGIEQQARPRRQGRQGTRVRSARARIITRKGCQFRERGKTWSLVRTCTPRGTIVVPNGYTLNGRNRALFVTGNVRRFDGAVVVAGFGRANVRNLRIEGKAGLTGACPDLSAGILFFFASGTIANVTIRNIQPGPTPCLNSAGIFVAGDKRVNILSSTIQNAGLVGLILQGLVGGTIAGNEVRIGSNPLAGFTFGIQLARNTGVVIRNNDFRPSGNSQTMGILAVDNFSMAIFGNRFHGTTAGITVQPGPFATLPTAVIRDNQMTGVVGAGINVVGGTVLVLRNSVAGASPASGAIGLSFGGATSGVANSNALSNLTCGIFNTSPVTLGMGAQANTFMNNGQDVCP